jgi:hypothetical protein
METVTGDHQTTGGGRGAKKKKRAKQKEQREDEKRKGEETKEKERERQQKMDDLEWKILTVAIHEIIKDSPLNIEIIEDKGKNCLKLINHTPEDNGTLKQQNEKKEEVMRKGEEKREKEKEIGQKLDDQERRMLKVAFHKIIKDTNL